MPSARGPLLGACLWTVTQLVHPADAALVATLARTPGPPGTGTYVLDRAEPGLAVYSDRPDTTLESVPAELLGQSLIRTVAADAAVVGDDFLSFTVTRSATVYVAFDAGPARRPAWLRSSFLDTGQQILLRDSAGGVTALELYGDAYAAGTRVHIGANAASRHGAMYTVIVAPASVDTRSPSAPGHLRIRCAGALVVGLRWMPASDDVGVARYRVLRDGLVIGSVAGSLSEYDDSDVAPDHRYGYAVDAVDAAGNVTRSAPIRVHTAPASPRGDAAYCPSARITGMTFDFKHAFSETRPGGGGDGPPWSDGSDLWPLTWGVDGNVYTFFGDGWGLCGELDSGSQARREDYVSFGFARIVGSLPLATGGGCPAQFLHGNLYGGYDSPQTVSGSAGLVHGKLGALIAVGRDFYGIGALWRPSDRGGPTDSPDRDELVYSLGGATSWRANDWIFCSADAQHQPDATSGIDGGPGVCPSGFINFGPGNAGAGDGFVYLYASNNNAQNWGGAGEALAPQATYLLRVPSDRLLDRSAYQYFAGLDDHGRPQWSTRSKRREPVFEDRNPARHDAQHGFRFQMSMGIGEAAYNARLGRYIATAMGPKIGQLAFYEAPHPWGPWSVVYYTNIDAERGGHGGWGGLGAGTWKDPRYVGADSLGVHIGNAWTSADGKRLWLVFSSDGLAPPQAEFRALAGRWMDSFNAVEARLKVR